MVSMIGFGTNVEFQIVAAPALLLGVALLGASTEMTFRWIDGSFVYSLYLVVATAAFLCWTRERMQAVGAWGNYSCGYSMIAETDPFFGHFKACPPFFAVLHETDQVIAENRGTPVFFGPRMEFLYAREHIPSPKGLPLWWHPGTSFPLQADPSIVRSWKDDQFGLLVFLHQERTHMPQAILKEMDHDYIEKTVGSDTSGTSDEGRIDVYTPK